MQLADSYRWEAETETGRILTSGGDLAGCVRVSFVANRPGLQCHDLLGVTFLRRFGRSFIRMMGNKKNEYVQCVVCEGFRFYLRCSDGAVLITPADYELYL